MPIQIKHAFTSPKGDGTDATFVQPSYWNALHATSMATNSLIGRLTAGAGAFEEIPLSPFMADLLGSPDAATLATKLGLFTTGDVKFSINGTANAGWLVYLNFGTIGSAASSATFKSDTYINLFKVIWNIISDTYCPVVGGRGASADLDWTNGKQIYLPQFGGRAILAAGTIAGVTTARYVGQYGGEETHTLLVAELAAHRHSAGLYNPDHGHNYTAPGSMTEQAQVVAGASAFFWSGRSPPGNHAVGTDGATWGDSNGLRVYSSDAGLDTTYLAGNSTPFNVMQPYITMWVHIKL